jgi:hypothetical protein
MNRALPCVVMLSLALVAGCGDGQNDGDPAAGGTTGSTSTSAPARGATPAPVSNAGSNPEFAEINAQEVKAQNIIADCMKEQGFQYIPHPMVYGGGATDVLPRYTLRASLLEPADTVRAWRQKYGFGRYARLVYPNDPQVTPPEPAPNPNTAIVQRLDPAQQKAYGMALNGQEGVNGQDGGVKDGKPSAGDQKAISKSCQTKAGAVFDAEAPETDATRKKEAADRRLYRKFQTDPAVVAAAQEYAGCLRKRGFRPARTQPGFIETALVDGAPEPEEGISAAAAKRGLAKEVKAALADLDCRTSYATIMRTQYPAVAHIFGGIG